MKFKRADSRQKDDRVLRHRSWGMLVLIAYLLCAGIAWLPGKTGAAVSDTRSLTFAERVGYQRAIEEVYWRHRIWPKDNPDPKPPLDVVISRAELEKKVTDYLRESEAVGKERGSEITASELQAEMDRMAQHTGQSDVLRELFAALGNDPFVIAECLARPILAGRFVSELGRESAVEAFVSNAGAPGTSAPTSSSASRLAAYKVPDISIPKGGTDDTWTATTFFRAPDSREFHTAVWTGSEMIIWGGLNLNSGILNTGARYNPATDSWAALSIVNAPSARVLQTAVWTGSEMIIWGGYNNGVDMDSGGKYNPAADSWTPTNTADAPLGRESHTAVWTGSEMIVWGGVGCGRNCRLNTGGRYNPSTDSWAATSISNAPASRWEHTAVWTGTEMIIWGGTDQAQYLNTLGIYNPVTDSWMAPNPPFAPTGRVAHTAIWTGTEMIVWGGVENGTFADTNTGAIYDPGTDSWTPTSLASGAPTARDSHSAVWTGREMIIWGGGSFPGGDLNTGSRYAPGTDGWTPMTTISAPFARAEHTAVWAGDQMIVWGGVSYNTGFLLNTGGVYRAQPSEPLVQSAVSRKTQGNAGSFDLDLPLDGTVAMECRGGGGSGDYTIVLTFLANVSVSGNPQATVTSGKGTIGSGGVSNGGMVVTSGNVVTIPLTNVANAQTIEVTLNNVNGSTNVTIPMSVLVGDVNGNATVNASDVALIKAHSGQPVDATTYRFDVTADGNINATDVALVKASSGTALP